MKILDKISALQPGERIPYSIHASGKAVYELAEVDETIVLTQQKIDGKFIYYVNRVSVKAADILEDLKEGPDIFSCFWVREKLTSD